ncbi:hypothetical protein ACIA8G_35085 [Lentzea sp. NPDC051213]|uniref:hypothetical protein n=1 Tax=Lentzea sp. NPDC051213 TaxID=3364126 RepID=UPI0037B959D9
MDQTAKYLERAKQRVREVLDVEHAVVGAELTARISEAGFNKSGQNIDAHHVTNALRELTAAGDIIQVDPEATRGKHTIKTIQPADQKRRKTAIARAAARKRLLYARYLSWASGSVRYPHGHIGPAGEEAVRTAILASGQLQPERADFGPVNSLLGVPLPGELDSAGYHVPKLLGVPQRPITVMVEVKNVRGWIYPGSEELYQLLNKALVLQLARPDQLILPVFVCRRAHITAFWMAQQLGFMIVDMELQYIGNPDLDKPEHFDEVRVELHFDDLRVGTGPSLRTKDRLIKVLPDHATNMALAWMETVANEEIAELIPQLRTASYFERNELMEQLRDAVKRAGHKGF